MMTDFQCKYQLNHPKTKAIADILIERYERGDSSLTELGEAQVSHLLSLPDKDQYPLYQYLVSQGCVAFSYKTPNYHKLAF